MTIAEQIAVFKAKRKLPNVAKFNAEWNPKQHKIYTDLNKYRDRTVLTDVIQVDGSTRQEPTTIPLNRRGLPFQKKIVNIAMTFFCGNEIKYTNDIEDATLYDAFIEVLKWNKTSFLDAELFVAVSRYTEAAVLWYHVVESNNRYGFDSRFRLKHKLLTPEDYDLYPVFDDFDDLVSFSRGWKVENTEHFEAYTAEKITKFERNDGEWVITSDISNPIGKIPITYYKQDDVEWADVQDSIERIEHVYSNASESNDKFAFPILGLWGEVTGSFSQDKTGRVLQFGEQGKGEFIAQPNASESLSEELDRLERDVHDFTSTPNISFDNMKGLGNMMAGSSAKFLFLSAHLKVRDKMKIYVTGYERRASIIKSFLQAFNTKWEGLELSVTPVVTPYVIDNDAEFIEMLLTANGNQPLFSQKYTMEKYGIADPDAMIEQIREETELKAGNDVV